MKKTSQSSKIIEQQGQCLRIYSNSQWKSTGKGFTYWGFGIGILFSATAYILYLTYPQDLPFLWVILTALGIGGLIAGLVGVLCWMVTGRKCLEIDLTRQQVTFSNFLYSGIIGYVSSRNHSFF